MSIEMLPGMMSNQDLLTLIVGRVDTECIGKLKVSTRMRRLTAKSFGTGKLNS